MRVGSRMSWALGILWTSVGAGALGCSSAAPGDGGVTKGGGGTSGSAVTVSSALGSVTFGGPCVPISELDPTFQGFSVEDVSVESNAPTCSSSAPVCLINHFQGRTSCPFGQTTPGAGPRGPAGSPAASFSSEEGCLLPGQSSANSSGEVTATNVSIPGFGPGSVPPQIVGVGAGNRTASSTVYCSCRCANIDGETNDGATYCACPGGSSCTQLVTAIGGLDEDITGAYCVVDGTAYDAALATSSTCDAAAVSPAEPGYCSVEY